jgi:quinol monooxygenase YgiN
MIPVIIRMKVFPEKRMELTQTILLLIGSIRAEKGCKRCDFCQSIEDENRLFLLEEWDTEENLMSYLKSGRFRVLRGAMNLLREPYEMIFHTVSHPAKSLKDGKRDEKEGSDKAAPIKGEEKKAEKAGEKTR